jgi:S1-C subfamily serine protease
VTNTLSSLSDDIAAVASAAAPRLAVIHLGPRSVATGVIWSDRAIVVADRVLPAQDDFMVTVIGGGTLTATPAHRDPDLGLATLRIDRLGQVAPLPLAGEPALGSLVVVVGAAFDATPTVRLAVVHRIPRAARDGAELDVRDVSSGALVLDPAGAIVGIAITNDAGSVSVVPYPAIDRLTGGAAPTAPSIAREAPRPSPVPPTARRGVGRRGWFGISLQPITVPEPLVARAGKTSARLIVGVTPGGPAEAAGLRAGDVLLSLDGHGTTGAHSLRAFLESTQAGQQVEAKVLRDASVVTTWLTVASQP